MHARRRQERAIDSRLAAARTFLLICSASGTMMPSGPRVSPPGRKRPLTIETLRAGNPDRQGFHHARYALLMVEDKRSSSAHRKWLAEPKLGERRLKPLVGLAPTNTSLQLTTYNTRPVASEAQRLESGALMWICTTNFRLRRSCEPSGNHQGVQVHLQHRISIGINGIRHVGII